MAKNAIKSGTLLAMKGVRPTRRLTDNNGAVMVEFAMMMPLIIILMVFLMATYEFVEQMITVQQDIRYELRTSIDKNSGGPFHRVIVPGGGSSNVFVEMPGKMKDILGRPYIRSTMTLSGYEGCYQQRGHSKYGNRARPIRLININSAL